VYLEGEDGLVAEDVVEAFDLGGVQFRHEEVDGLLDRVQLHFPAVMSTLLAAATDMMLLNILPSQYNQFVACLKSFKRRLNGVLNRPQDWDEFFTNFKKKHRGKKRLIQVHHHHHHCCVCRVVSCRVVRC
jgi:hypothetical protein